MCARAFFTKFSAVFMCILYNNSPRFMGITPKNNRNHPLFFGSPGKSGIVSTDRRFCGSHQRPPAGAVRRFGPAAACKKPYFCPPGVSVLNKKKEGRCTQLWCSCHLNLFQHLCIIFLLSGTRAFQMSLRRPIWDAFSVIPYKRDAAECAAEVDRYLMGYTNL